MVLIGCEVADRAVEVRSRLRSLQTKQAIDIDDMFVGVGHDLLGSARLIYDCLASCRTLGHVKHAALPSQPLPARFVAV